MCIADGYALYGWEDRSAAPECFAEARIPALASLIMKANGKSWIDRHVKRPTRVIGKLLILSVDEPDFARECECLSNGPGALPVLGELLARITGRRATSSNSTGRYTAGTRSLFVCRLRPDELRKLSRSRDARKCGGRRRWGDWRGPRASSV